MRLVSDYILFGKGRLFGAWDWKIETKTEPLWSFLPAKFKTNDPYGVWRFRLMKNTEVIAENFLFSTEPKDLLLSKAKIKWRTIGRDSLELESDKFAYGVFIDVPDGVELEGNYFHLIPNEKKIVKFISSVLIEQIKKQIKIKSLVDTY